MKIFIESLEKLPEAARKVVDFLDLRSSDKKKLPCIAFYGAMGVGKTTFIKSLCRELGVDDNVNSPTFSIINEYLDERAEKIYHFDFYRIESLTEAYDFGYEDYFYSGNLCLIEWAEKIETLLPKGYISISIEAAPDNTRTLEVVLD